MLLVLRVAWIAVDKDSDLCEVCFHLSPIEFVMLDEQFCSSSMLWLGEYHTDTLEAFQEIDSDVGVDLLEHVGEVGLHITILVNLLRNILKELFPSLHRLHLQV